MALRALAAARYISHMWLHVQTPVGNTFMMYRLGVNTLLKGAWLNLKYSLVFFFFFNGLSFHLSAAFASHLLGFQMSWGSTSKEIKDTNFFKEVSAPQARSPIGPAIARPDETLMPYMFQPIARPLHKAARSGLH